MYRVENHIYFQKNIVNGFYESTITQNLINIKKKKNYYDNAHKNRNKYYFMTATNIDRLFTSIILKLSLLLIEN